MSEKKPPSNIRREFWGRTFGNLDDLNARFEASHTRIATPHIQATTQRINDETFAEKRPSLQPLRASPYSAVLTIERRVTKDGMISVGGTHSFVPPSRDSHFVNTLPGSGYDTSSDA